MARITVPGVQENVQGTPDRPQGADAAAFGGIAAKQAHAQNEAQMQTAEAFVRIAADMNERQETQDAIDADTAMKKYAGERTAEMRKVQGADAAGIAARESEAFGKARDKIAGGLNGRARLVFETRAHATGQAFADNAARHEFEQTEKAYDQSMTANLNADLNNVMANPGNIGIQRGAVKNIEQIAEVMARRRGWTPEFKKLYIEERVSMLHTGTIETMIDSGQYSEAAAYYKTFQKEVVGHKQKDMEKLLKEGNIRQTAMEFTDKWGDMIDRSTSLEELAVLEKTALSEARKEIKDPYKRERTETELKNRFAEQRRLMDEVVKANTKAGIDAYTQGGFRVAAIPPTVWEKMNPKTKFELQQQEVAGIRREDHEGDPAGFENERMRAAKLIQSGQPYEFDTTSPAAVKMNKSQRDYLYGLSLSGAKKQAQPDTVPSASELDLYYRQMGMLDRNDPETAHKKDLFRETATQALAEARAKKPSGAPLTSAERQEVFRSLVREGVTKERSLWRNERKRYWEVWGGAERERWFTEDEIKANPGITDEGQLAAIDKQLTADNKPITKSNRIQQYQEWTKRRREEEAAKRAANPPARQRREPLQSPEEY